MLFVLMFIGFIVIGAIVFAIQNIYNFPWKVEEILENIGLVLIIIGIIAEIVCGICLLINRAVCDLDYQNTLYEREMIEYRLDHREDNLIDNEMLYHDIVEFNKKLRSQKKWANNLWTNWFNNEKIAALDYIELSGE